MLFQNFLFVCAVISCVQFAFSKDETDDLYFVGFHNVATMPYGRSDMTVTTFPAELYPDDPNGFRIYIVGGCIQDQICSNNYTTGVQSCYCPTITNGCNYFTPKNELWHDCSSAIEIRYRHMAASVESDMYIIGGRRATDDSIITTIEKYNTLNDTWTMMWNWPAATSDGQAFSYQGILYLVGGYDASYHTPGILTSVDIHTGQFSTNYPIMPTGRGDISVVQFNNLFYIIGGWNATSSNGFCTPSNAVEAYNPITNEWIIENSLSHGRGDLAVGVMGKFIFALGGETKALNDVTCTHSVPVAEVERYSRTNTSWYIEENIPNNIFRFVGGAYNSTTDILSNAIFLFGGQGTYDEERQVFPILNATIKYVPQTYVDTYSGGSSSSPKLSPGGIAGVTIAAIVVGIVLVMALLSYLEYRRRGYRLLAADDNATVQSTGKGVEVITATPSGSGGAVARDDLVMIELSNASHV